MTTPPVFPDWVLTETVDVTMVHSDPDTVLSVYLVERVHSRGALVLSFSDTGRVLTNGLDLDLGEDLMAVCGLIDGCAGQASPDGVMPIGHSFRSEPDEEATRWMQ